MNTAHSDSTSSLQAAPRIRFDDQGHIVAFTEEEALARSAAIKLALAEIAAIPDNPAESDEEFWRAIDAGRPDRPLFRELYEP